MDTRDIYKLVRELSEEKEDAINLYDSMDIELNEGFVIETGVVGFMDDGVIVHLDEDALEFLEFNGILLEDEQPRESHSGSDAAYNAILNRIVRQQPELLSTYGPAAVQYAIEDVANGLDDVEEIGSSDVSIWVKYVVQDLESGNYDHLREEETTHRDEHGNVTKRMGQVDVDSELSDIIHSEDPFDLVYRYLSGDGGPEMQSRLQDMYNNVSVDNGLHPDDDFEEIISIILDHLENEYNLGEGAYSDHWDPRYDADGDASDSDKARAMARRRAENDGWDPRHDERDQIDELALIKKLASGNTVNEAEYQGRKVTLNKPMAGDVKKSKVYVKKPNGKVVKVNFGDKNMRIKKSNPNRRKSFRARHNCDNPGPKWKARYWSCRAW